MKKNSKFIPGLALILLLNSTISIAGKEVNHDPGVRSYWYELLQVLKAPKTETPEGYHKYITFIANGEYPTPDGTILLDGLAGDGLAFQREIMGRTDVQIEAKKAQATTFFEQRFGLSTFDTENLLFTGYQVDPRNRLTAYISSDEKVPKDGWAVLDGGFQLIVTNPEGITLGGEFAGVHVDAGATFVFGEYKIMRKVIRHWQLVSKPMIMRYQSKVPMQFGSSGAMARCDLFSDTYGEGFVGGVIAGKADADGIMHSNIRSTLTFPPLAPKIASY
ncbi:MAG: hypothetical protein ACI9FJ_001851 [Alteromonadaceae bacterium]|jgi:hypothetical protein